MFSKYVTPVLQWLLGPAVFLLFPFCSEGQVSLPQVNLGLTNFEDGVAFPGFLIEETGGNYRAGQFKDRRGQTIPGSNEANAITSLTHIAWVSKWRILGGYFGAEVVLPAADVHVDTSFGPRARTIGTSDLIFGPAVIEWNDKKLFKRPLFQRALLDVAVPTGQYDANSPVNIGNHLINLNPYYAFTYIPTKKIEISGRLHYLWNGKNDRPFAGLGAKSIQPGQAFHQNLASSYQVTRILRVGLGGYLLEQITDHRINDIPLPGSRERTFAIGPGIEIHKDRLFVYLNTYFEAGVRNRPQGFMWELRVSTVIPSMLGLRASASPGQSDSCGIACYPAEHPWGE